jgi:predicted negative regulator of RcsB-dependent stress response
VNRKWKWLLAGFLLVVIVLGGWRVMNARRVQLIAQQQLAAQRADRNG